LKIPAFVSFEGSVTRKLSGMQSASRYSVVDLAKSNQGTETLSFPVILTSILSVKAGYLYGEVEPLTVCFSEDFSNNILLSFQSPSSYFWELGIPSFISRDFWDNVNFLF
jgi:hypothetical protein